jgi:predicted Zn-dependent peptidase
MFHATRSRRVALALVALALATAPSARAAARPRAGGSSAAPARPAASIPVEEHTLSNGMKLLLVPRHLSPTFAGGWVAHVGSANERPGITGMSHLFEHMMFKGTHVIGTRDYDKDLRLIEEQEGLQDEMRAEMSKLRAARRRGEIEDIARPESRTPRMRELEARFDSLVQEQRANMVKNEFNLVLQRNGATGINAFTNEDMTFYFESLPANRLELWFWLESDRLKNRVFREFYSERDVVYEERRLRTESTPTGVFDESFDALFWDASPYAWPVVGWPSDLAGITKAQADEYYALYYAPRNLTAVLVGDFDPARALALAERYLGSIPAGSRTTPEMITTETRSLAEKRFYGEAETNPALEARWHTVAFVHRDMPALQVLAEALNGPAGRLQRNLVLGAGLAASARAGQDARKYEGSFSIRAEAKGGHTPAELEQAIYGEVDRLKREPVAPDELTSVKNRYLASTYRQLTSNFPLMLRYGVADGRGSWRDADRIDREVQAVTAADVQRVARNYLTRENRAVAVWTRKSGGEAEDPAVAALSPEAKEMVRHLLGRIKSATQPAEMEQLLSRMDQMMGSAPPEAKAAIDYVRSRAQARMSELSGARPGEEKPR